MAVDAVRPSLFVAAVLAAAAALGLLAGIRPELAAAAAVALLFVAVVLDNVALGLALLAFMAFLDVLPRVGDLSIAKLVGALLVVSWLAAVSTHRDRRSLLRDRPLLAWGILLFLVWVVLSMLWAEDRAATVTALQRYAPNLLLFPIAYTAIRRAEDGTRVLAVIVVGAALAAAAGLVSPPADAGFEPSRATGTVGDANELAAALVAGGALAAAFAVNRGFSSAARMLAAGAAGLCLLGIFLSLSRGGLIALAVALVVAVAFSGRWRGRATALAIVAGGAAILYFASVASLEQRERVLELGGGGSGRVDLWTVAGRMVEAHPVRGVGAGNFPTASIHYLLQPGTIQRDDFIINADPFVTHNTYLQVLAEGGVVGLALFLAIVAMALGAAILAAMSFARQDDRRMEVLARGLVVATAGYLVAIFFISEMYSKLLWILLAMGPPLLAVARARERDAAAEITASGAPAAPRRGPAAARW